jgi:formylglycine-generating enzyme required for sulfatase activity
MGPRREKPFTNTVGMLLVPIPRGEFDMGAPQTEAGRDKDETLHHVKFTKGFYMATTPVTQGQWTGLMGTTVAQQRDKAVADTKASTSYQKGKPCLSDPCAPALQFCY